MKWVTLIGTSKYLDFLSKFGVGGAHPGGINLTRELLLKENINKNSIILDVGCGTGQTAAYLASQYGARVIGMDINPVMVQKAQRRIAGFQLPVEIIQGSIENCPIRSYSFDFIISESVLAFVDKPRALKEIFRLLKNGGRFIGNELTINHQLAPIHKEEIKQFYGLDTVLMETEWISLLKQTGFQNINIRRKKPHLSQNHSSPEYQYSQFIEPELFAVMKQHFQIMLKYKGTLDYRIFSCTKINGH